MLGDFRELIYFFIKALLQAIIVPITLLYTILQYGLVGFAVYCGVSGLILWAYVKKGGDW
jgi:membrane protein implicated in regulation of membrane protease activity